MLPLCQGFSSSALSFSAVLHHISWPIAHIVNMLICSYCECCYFVEVSAIIHLMIYGVRAKLSHILLVFQMFPKAISFMIIVSRWNHMSLGCWQNIPFQLLDLYFGSVCELDIIYNYEKVRKNLFIMWHWGTGGQIYSIEGIFVLENFDCHDLNP